MANSNMIFSTSRNHHTVSESAWTKLVCSRHKKCSIVKYAEPKKAVKFKLGHSICLHDKIYKFKLNRFKLAHRWDAN